MELRAPPDSIRLLLDKALDRPIPSITHISLCPTLDLIAVVTASTIVEVFRFSGHRAFGAESHNKRQIKSIAWSHDGNSLSIFWDGGMLTELPCSKTGLDTVHVNLGSDEVDGEATATTSLFPCVCKLQKPFTSEPMLESGADQLGSAHQRNDSVYPGLDQEEQNNQTKRRTDAGSLPSILDAINLRSHLPLLDAAPPLRDPALWQAVGGWNQSNVPFDEGPSKQGEEDGSLLLMLRGAQKNSLLNLAHGNCKFELEMDRPNSLEITHITSHPAASSFALLTMDQTWGTKRLYLFSLNAFAENGRHLRMVDKSMDALHRLTRYLLRSIDSLRHYWKAGRRSFLAQIENICEELEASGGTGPDIVKEFYKLAMTGHCLKAVKKWIAEDMGAQGITRWYQPLAAALQQIVTVTKENILPAIEHLSLLAASLRILSHRGNEFPICDINDKTLQNLNDDLETLKLISTKVLAYAELEAHRTYVFSEWLMQTSTILTDPLSNAAKDAEKKIADTDYAELTDFIIDCITKNKLNVLLGRPTDQVLKAARRPGNLARRTIELMLKRHEDVNTEPTTPFVELLNLLHAGLYIFDCEEKLNKDHRDKIRAASQLRPMLPADIGDDEISTDLAMMRSLHDDPKLSLTSVTVTLQPHQRTGE